jgi:hypothetical protein
MTDRTVWLDEEARAPLPVSALEDDLEEEDWDEDDDWDDEDEDEDGDEEEEDWDEDEDDDWDDWYDDDEEPRRARPLWD